MALAAKNLARTQTGRYWMAVRDMDLAAEVTGIDIVRTKLVAFAVSSFYCGVAGALWAYAYLGAVEPQAFTLDRSFQVLFMIIIGGVGTVLGAFLGAAFIVLLPIALNVGAHTLLPGRQHRPHVQPRARDLRRAHRLLPCRRAARARPGSGRSARKSCGYGRSRIEP